MKAVKYQLGLFLAMIFFLISCPSYVYGTETQENQGKINKIISISGRQPSEPAPETFLEDISDWEARWELAKLLSYVKRYEESIAEYRKVLKARPDLVKAKIEMARVLSWSGKPDEAYDTLRGILLEKMDENARILMADLYMERKEYEKSEAIYQAYLKSHPDDLKIRLKLAQVMGWTKRYEESIAQYKIILKARPDDIQVRRNYAFVLIWAGRHADAISELRKTLD